MKIRDLYIEFFKGKDHAQIESAPVVPINDPSVLFNTAGMQPLVPYLMGLEHPLGKRLVDYQKCIRTNDLDEIGDTTHHTFFEMLGNWSLGDYFKKESIHYSYEFLTEVLNIPVDKLAVTCFEGNESIPKDEYSANVWREIGISEDRIAFLGVEDNFWIAGDSGPCGPDTEIFYFRSNEETPKVFDPSDDRWVEIWNNVFMEFNKDEQGNITELPSKNVDTGMGLERITSVLENVNDNYQTSIWQGVIKKIEDISNLPYEGNEKDMRIIADHIRTSVFISADDAGVKPSNTAQGYILRRLIRRIIIRARNLGIDLNSDYMLELAKVIINDYKIYYNELSKNESVVYEVLKNESIKFNATIEKGFKEIDKIIKNLDGNTIDADLTFKLHDTYGFPLELTCEVAAEVGLNVDIEGYKEKFKLHQEKSRTGITGKFKGGLVSTGDTETKLHTAAHLLLSALKIVLGEDTTQKGNNITPERLRFDFSCDHKLTDEEKTRVEDLVNKWINEAIDVEIMEMTKQEAFNSGAECHFIERYPDIVSVYKIGDVSYELCGGPHVNNTSEIGTFKIVKEDSSSSGVRRIKAVIS